jgi:hypothetical protein
MCLIDLVIRVLSKYKYLYILKRCKVKRIEYIISRCRESIPKVEKGIFGADMKVSLLNDGPFTILLDSAEIC